MSKEISWRDEYLNINEREDTWNLHDQLFLVKPIELVEYFAGAINAGDKSFRWLMSESDAWGVFDHIVKTQLPRSHGRVNLKALLDSVKDVIKTIGMIEHFIDLEKVLDQYKSYTVNDNSKHIFAEGILNEDYYDDDKDPYVTAGGYRKWKATKGERCYYSLNRDLSIDISFNSNCMIDHYNNNIGGVSTGGGTTTYDEGDRVERRFVTGIGREFTYKNWKKCPIDATVTKLDYGHLTKLANDFQNALWSAIKNKKNGKTN